MVQNEAEVDEHIIVTKDKTSHKNYSVTIIGGGPSGIAAGLTLNSLGVSNCVVDANLRPNRKYGEAIPPNSKPLLKQLGISSLVEDLHHLKYYGNKVSWGSSLLEQKEFLSDVHGHGYLLDRLYFEEQLWKHYVQTGGIILSGNKLKSIEIENKKVITTISDGTKSKKIESIYVVDATGKKASVCRMLGIKKFGLDDQFALSCVVETKNNHAHEIIVESSKNGWWYAAPNGNNKMTLMFFTLKGLIPKKSNIKVFFQGEFQSTIHFNRLIQLNWIDKIEIKVMPAGTTRLEKSFGDHWIAVGDAAFTYDPISSYGITSALASGYYAGNAIFSKINGKEEAMEAYRYILENAFGAYIEKLEHQYRLERRWPESQYWKNRLSH